MIEYTTTYILALDRIVHDLLRVLSLMHLIANTNTITTAELASTEDAVLTEHVYHNEICQPLLFKKNHIASPYI